MKAMILAAGRGSRLRPHTDHTPKPLLTVQGRPLIDHQIEWLTGAGICEVVINLHHLGDQIESHLGNGASREVSITYSREQELLETGGGIRAALPLLGAEPFIILNGDIYTDFDFTTLPPHLPDDCLAHIVVTPKPAFREHGDLVYDRGRISARGDTHVYCGIALLHPRLFDGCPEGAFSLRDLYFRAIEHGQLSAQLYEGEWTDIGTPDQLQALQ